nr:transglutaminase-like domain-containing protein [uncultured Niameybacter sp.]
MKPLKIRIIILILYFYCLPLYGTTPILFNETALDLGIIRVTYTGKEEIKLKVMIEKVEGKEKYTYDLLLRNKAESFPLQMGNGTYKISVLKNVKGTSYALVDAKTVVLNLKDEKNVYLTSIQNINWSSTSKPVQKAVDLVDKTKNVEEKAKILYRHVIYEYTYDYDKLATLAADYLPNIDVTYDEKTGICYDFSSLYAAMLRSQQIPTKLVKGYSENAKGYHAWNEVYDEQLKEWVIVDTTYDLQVIKKKPYLKWIKSNKVYEKVKEY